MIVWILMYLTRGAEGSSLRAVPPIPYTYEHVSLLYSYNGTRPQLFQWYRNNKLIAFEINENGTCMAYGQEFIRTLYVDNCGQGSVFNLTILNVTADNELWRCVLLKDGRYHEQQSNNVTIKVAVPVQQVQLYGTITDILAREGQFTTVSCTASGYPAPNIVFGISLATCSLPGGNVIEGNVTVQSENNAGNINVISTLTFVLNRTQTNKTLCCFANNSVDEAPNWILSNSIRLDIYYPPSTKPIIQGNTSVYFMIRNSSTIQHMSCSMTGGNPLAKLDWDCYSGKQSTEQSSNTVTRTITWKAEQNNNRTCYCKASHESGWNWNVSIDVAMLYGPSPPTCKIGSEFVQLNNISIKVIKSDTLKIECSSSSSPPVSDYMYVWTLPNSTMVRGNQLVIPNIKGNDTLYSLEITNVMTPTIGNDENGIWKHTFYVDILSPPSPLDIVYHGNDYYTITNTSIDVIRGRTYYLSCISESNPPARIRWINQPQDNESLLINAMADTYPNQTCEATNKMKPTGYTEKFGTGNTTLAISVLFPPDQPRLYFNQSCDESVNDDKIAQNISVVAGQTLTIRCESTSRPESTYSWNTPSGSTISNSLHIASVKSTHKGAYTCTANNIMRSTFDNHDVYGNSSYEFAVDVLEQPEIKEMTIVEVLLNTELNISCPVQAGNPKETYVQWTWVDNTKYPNETLFIEQVALGHEGFYTCSASNNMTPTGCRPILGKTTQRIYVDVQYEANISEFYERHFAAGTPSLVTINQALPLELICNVASDPRSNIKISYYGHTDEYEDIKAMNNGYYAVYQVHNSSCEYDMGTYKCSAGNKHNAVSEEKLIDVLIRCSPRLSFVPEHVRNITKHIGETATFLFNVIAYPAPDMRDGYTWEKLTSNDNWEVLSTTTNTSETSIGRQQTKFIIYNIQPDDFGQYRVNISNTVDGQLSETFFLIANDRAESSQGSSVVGAAIGIVLGVLIVIIAVVVVVFKLRGINFAQAIRNWLRKPSNHSTKATKGSSAHRHEYVNHGQIKSVQGNQTCEFKMDTVTPPPPFATIQPTLPTEIQFAYQREEDIQYSNIQGNESRTLTLHLLRQAIKETKTEPAKVYTEFNKFQRVQKYQTQAAQKTCNISKNRYKNIYPYDFNRVVLPSVDGREDTDFINASYINGYYRSSRYIAAQGPQANTIEDFWKMILSENISVVVMLTNTVEDAKRKCFQYWYDNSGRFGDYTIRTTSCQTYANYVVRQLECITGHSVKKHCVTHFHFTTWPDKDIPDTSLAMIQFWNKIRNHDTVTTAPILVHCSAGVGRTGTFIALDYLYDQGIAEGMVNVYDAVETLRDQRMCMVQTKEQYLYLHECVCETLCPIGEVYRSEEFSDLSTSTEFVKYIEQEFEELCGDMQTNATSDCVYANAPGIISHENIEKNLDDSVVPNDKYRPMLNMSCQNSYNNAVYISTYLHNNKLILIQYPLEKTSVEFVSLIRDHQAVSSLVVFGEKKNEQCWGTGDSKQKFHSFTLETQSVQQMKHFTKSSLRYTYSGEFYKDEHNDLRHYEFTSWPDGSRLCTVEMLLDVWKAVTQGNPPGPVVLQCRDGYTRSGLFAVLWSVLEQTKVDGEVAIAQAVRIVRRRRPQVITDLEQYKFCHDVSTTYIEQLKNTVYENL